MSVSDLRLNIEQHVQDAIQKQVSEYREDIIRMATKEFERRIRKAVGEVAINLANYYNIERLGTDLVIRVHIDKA